VSRRAGSAAEDAGRLIATGVAAGVIAGVAMDTFSRLVSASGNGREAKGAAPGADRTGRGVQPAQAEGHAEEDATVKAGTLAYEAITGDRPDRETRLWLGRAAHYGFSISAGVMYVLLANRFVPVRAGYGTLYGTAVWAVADEGIVPALGLSRGPRQLPANVLAFGLLGHLVYGAALEAVRRLGATCEQPPMLDRA
jgi:hypothetical protein